MAYGHAIGETSGVTSTVPGTSIGSLVRQWRQRRRISQLDLAIEADVSPRHVSFIETGRAQPSRAMVLRLAEALDVPRREQNQLLLAAGLAPCTPNGRSTTRDDRGARRPHPRAGRV